MTIPNYLRILTLSLLTIASIASCQNHQSGKREDPPKVRSSQQIFWDSLPKPTGYVNDYEGLFTSREEDILTGLIREFEKRTTIQIAVVTLDTTMTTADSLAALTLRIANTWGVGQKDKNNGIVIAICHGCRRLQIQSGYGIEKILTNAETMQIIDSVFKPKFSEAKYYEGTNDGLKALMAILEKRYK